MSASPVTPDPPTPGLADPAYFASHEAARAGVLRRRMVWFLGTLLFLLALSSYGTFLDYQEYVEGKSIPPELAMFGALDDVCLAALVLATLLYILRMRPDRARLVRAITVSTVLTMAVATFFEIRRAAIHQTDFMGNPVLDADPHLWGARWGLFCHWLIVWISLLIIPMRWAESVRIALACWGVYIVLVSLQARPPLSTTVVYSLLALIVPLPAMLFSAWRYQRFDAQFEHAHLKGRFSEISEELVRARQLHEALFPPPSEDGPVHVRFTYRPMREIGGDFLYVHRVPADTPASPREMFILLVDVSGHGVTAALAVNRIHGELARLFASEPSARLSADRVIGALNAYVCAALAPQGVYATAICLRITTDPARSAEGEHGRVRVEWSSAGHPPGLLRTAAGRIHHLGPTATMLGVLEADLYTPSAGNIDALPGDVIVVYTDGLIEARSPDGQEFGMNRVEGLVAAEPASSTAERAAGAHIAPNLAALAEAHSAGRVTDDTLVVEIAIAPTPPPAPSYAGNGAGAPSSAG